MTTTLYAPAPYTGITSNGYVITQAGTAVPDGLVSQIISAVYQADGVVLTTSAGGTSVVPVGSVYNSGTGAPSSTAYPDGWRAADSTGAQFVLIGGVWKTAQSGTYAPALPAVGSFTYDGNGNVTADPEGHAYTYNTDGTVATETFGGVTRTYNWTSGVLTGVS